MDMIGQVNPPTSKGHKWILVATDYFTKWVEAVPMKNVTAKDVVNFIKEHIVYHFGIPQTITTDQGSVFLAEEFKNFAKEMGITLIQSSPYYAQANGQAEASNKTLIKLIKRKIAEYPKQWHDRLAEAIRPEIQRELRSEVAAVQRRQIEARAMAPPPPVRR
ncbi:uncharacterized protein K02A2.6-like [Panicum virgatum]|uniref:uncharacterized protein K02A2.6-like n=1 Tax=Panicum virgatum TaxID=38727 RepID=UPI0019D591D8|nr:uncharacterized protein K02A2.6-like [Panicum virgatum]